MANILLSDDLQKVKPIQSFTRKNQPKFIATLLIVSTVVLSPILPRSPFLPVKMAMAQTEAASTAPQEKTIVKVGVIAKRGEDIAIKKWQPTMDYLTKKIPGYRFELVPLNFEEIYEAAKDSRLDFFIIQPGMYVDFEGFYGASRIATLKNLRQGKSYTEFGGVILRRADRNDIQTLKDIKGKKLMAVNKKAFGGWQMQWGEMKAVGINPDKDLKELSFGETHDNVVYAVREGKVDVGAIRTDTLERMVKEGKINLDDFTVINQKTELQKDFPFLLSTRLYPEWPFAAAKDTPNQLSEKVASALLDMPKDSAAAKASKSEGWTVPLNYRPVDDLFLQLQIGPYEELGKVTLGKFLENYWYWFVISLVSLIVVVAIIIIYQQKQTEYVLKASAKQQQEVINKQKQAEIALKEIAEQQRQQKETLEKEIYQLLNELEGALEGDLTVRATLNSMEMSTVADLFNAIIDNLKDMAVRVKDSSTQVSSSLVENKQSIELLAEQAVEEAQETNKTLGSVEHMSLSIQEVSQNANQAAILANDAYTVTKESTTAMDETVNSILSLRTTVGETAKKMKRLGESSQKISQVVSLIEEIALKTNLLAINASVEASHAGEQGQGFTIVAEQVAALAEQSAAATKEITQIVEAIQLETQEVSDTMELGTSQVVDSTKLVESTKQRLEKVLERSQSINELMQSISQATISQTDTSLSVTKLMQQIAQYSQQRLASSQQVAKSMQATATVSQDLEFAVQQFKVS